MEIKIDTLITKGRGHELHCEDDLFVRETEEYVLAAVFDGCSSGVDSHFASTMHKYLLRDIFEDDTYIIHECDNRFYPYRTCEDMLETIVRDIRQRLEHIAYDADKEMLSTCVILYVNKVKRAYGICFVGDGCCMAGDDVRSVHDSNGNAVHYLSTVEKDEFGKYYSDYCTKIFGEISDGMTIAISTDGIESFVSKYGESMKGIGKDIFFKREGLNEKHRGLALRRLYNLLTNGKLNYMVDTDVTNMDDFTMISLTFFN